MLKRALLLAGVLALALAPTPTMAAPLLTGKDARAAMVRKSLGEGLEIAEPKRCKRESRSELHCQLVETGPWNGDPRVRAEGVWSVYSIRRWRGGVTVEWLAFVYVWPESARLQEPLPRKHFD